jgi:hypothetical protein
MAMIKAEIDAATDALGLPHIDDIVMPPASVVREVGLPTPGELVRRVVGDVKGKVHGLKGRLF